jgi:hypothetical protein
MVEATVTLLHLHDGHKADGRSKSLSVTGTKKDISGIASSGVYFLILAG